MRNEATVNTCEHQALCPKSQEQGRGGGGKGIEKRSKKLGVITVPFRQMNPYEVSTTTDW